MVNETNPLESSDPVDPLSNYSSFSLFPNFASSSSASFSLTENPNHDNLRSHLKDMVSQSPDNLMNQAKAILDGNLNLITSDKTKATVHEDQSAAVLTVNDKIPKERRPGLGRKRAKFTMKPMPSLPDVSLEPTIDIDELSDPEEYFAACERMDNAKKELRKQMGLPLIDLDQNRASMPARRRRPGLGLGRKVTYKRHPYPSIGFRDNDEVLLSSQEAPDPSVKSPSREEVIPEKNVMHFSPVATVSDVKVSMHNIGSELDDLLSCNFEELDEDGVQNLLQDKLNIKLVDIGKASLPGLPDVRGRDRERSSGAGTSMDTVNHENGTSRAVSSFSYHLRKSSTNHQVSPSLSKRPLASLAMVNRHISKLSPAKDPFSLIDIASSPVKTSSLGKHNTKEAEEIHENPNMHESLKSSLNEVDTTGGFTSPPASAGSCGGLNNGSEEQFVEVSHSDLIVTNKKSHEFTRPVAHEEIISTSEEKLASPIRKDVMPSGDPEELADQISPTARENLFESASPPTHGEDILGNPTSKPAEQEDRVAEARESVQEELFNKGSASMSLSSDKGEDGRIGETLKLKSSLKKPNKPQKAVGSLKSKRTETGDSMVPQETVCEETVNKGRKGKAKSSAPISKEPKLKKRRVEVPVPVPGEVDRILRRHSLYGAGTKWEAGLRRSTRIRMRPLEYWRGERVLYGRVNQSLVSVIGVKYASSTKNAEEYGVTVESFVSDQYKDLLDLASVH